MWKTEKDSGKDFRKTSERAECGKQRTEPNGMWNTILKTANYRKR